MKLKPEVCRELIRRQRVHRAVRRAGACASLVEMAEIVRANNYEIRANPLRAGLPTQAAINFRRLQLSIAARSN